MMESDARAAATALSLLDASAVHHFDWQTSVRVWECRRDPGRGQEKKKTEGNFNISSASVKKEKRLLAVLVIYTLMVWGREGVSERQQDGHSKLLEDSIISPLCILCLRQAEAITGRHVWLRTQLGSGAPLRLAVIKTITPIFSFIWPLAERCSGFVPSLRDSNVNEGGSLCRFARSQILFHFLHATAEALCLFVLQSHFYFAFFFFTLQSGSFWQNQQNLSFF